MFDVAYNFYIQNDTFFEYLKFFTASVLGFFVAKYTYDFTTTKECDESIEELRGILDSTNPHAENTLFSKQHAINIRKIMSSAVNGLETSLGSMPAGGDSLSTLIQFP